MKVYLFGLALLSLQATAGQIYQCGDTFQDRPCGGDKPVKVIGEYEPEKMTDEEIKAKQEELNKLEQQTEADIKARYDAEVAAAEKSRSASYQFSKSIKAVKSNQIIMGMNKSDVIKSWGSPDNINETVTKTGTSQQWIYVTPSGRQYVYLTNGVVTGWN